MAHHVRPPHDGSLTVIPGFVDFHAEHNADLPWAKYPSRSEPGAVESITFAQFSEATHRVAHKARPNRQGNDGEVVTLLIHCDTVLYAATLAGLIRANIVPLPVSPRNSPEAVANLMKKTGSRRLIITNGLTQTANAAQQQLDAAEYKINIEPLFSLYDIYPHLSVRNAVPRTEVTPYPAYDKPYNPEDVALILHSSGSTGLPKPIYKTRKIMLQWVLGDATQRSMEMGIQYGGMSLPAFHTMGIFIQLYGPLSAAMPVSLYTPQEPEPPVNPTPENVLEAAKITGCNGIVSVPSILEIWTQNPENLKFLASLKLLMFAGGPLSTANGNKLVEAGVNLQCTYGLTECGGPSKGYRVDRSLPPEAPVKTKWDWEWLELSDRVCPRWIPQGDGTYELHLLTCETHQPSVENLQDVRGYATSDLFIPHPTKKGLWKIVGRNDDVVVLGSGEKIVPVPQENHIVSSPFAIGAVMFGWGKPQPGVLIEPSPAYSFDPSNEAELVKYRNLIWPVIEEANHLAPTFARLFKETIIVATPTKPLPRAAKGTVMRKPALAVYKDEIEQLFITLEDSSNSQGISPPASWRPDNLESWLLEHTRSLNSDVAPLPDTDIFTVGFDSLSATILRNRIIGALRSSEEANAQSAAGSLSQNFIFEHPTVHQLAEAIASLVDPNSIAISQKNPVEEIQSFIGKYTAGLTARVQPSAPSAQPPIAVLLTGSTGNLGSHVVAALLSDDRVSKVYTFDRAASGSSPRERLRSAFEDRRLPSSLLATPRLVNLTGDLSEPSFGLDAAVFNELRGSLTHVVHNAWKVNFNHQLGSFEAQIAGTRKLVDFCLEAKRAPRLLFTSSISVAHGCDPGAGPIPEAPLPDPSVATSSGYASSKYVVEQIIDKASQLGLRGTSLRVGQVCGSKTTGAWNTSDWVPILVKSSITLGCLPDAPSSVDWVPMDAVAGSILDLIVSDESAPSVINVVHPRPVTWSAIFNGVKDALRPSIPLVPFHEWLAKLEEVAQQPTPAQLEAVPAIQLLSFFRGIGKGKEGSIKFGTSELCRLSPTMRTLEPLDDSYVRQWLAFWRGKKFIP